MSAVQRGGSVCHHAEATKGNQVATHTRKKSGNIKDVVPDNIPVEVVEHRLLKEERVCPQCGGVMCEIETEVRETLKLIPSKAILRRDVYYTYTCENCEKHDVSTPIVKAPKELVVIPGSFACSTEAITIPASKAPVFKTARR